MDNLQIFSNTFGFRITISTDRDLTTATNLRLRIRKPDASNVDKALTGSNVLEPKTEGNVFYDTVLGDFSTPGTYQLQLFDESGSLRLASEILRVKVKPSLDYVAP